EARLTTSLQRLGGDYADVEPHLLRNFRKYAQRTDVPEDSLWHWLALAKHHGLSTRLLDGRTRRTSHSTSRRRIRATTTRTVRSGWSTSCRRTGSCRTGCAA